MSAWVAVLLAGAGSYALRICAVVALARFTPPPWVGRASMYVMPAAFAALAASALAQPMAAGAWKGLPLLLAALATIAVARRSSASRAVLAGMAVLAAGLTVAALA